MSSPEGLISFEDDFFVDWREPPHISYLYMSRDQFVFPDFECDEYPCVVAADSCGILLLRIYRRHAEHADFASTSHAGSSYILYDSRALEATPLPNAERLLDVGNVGLIHLIPSDDGDDTSVKHILAEIQFLPGIGSANLQRFCDRWLDVKEVYLPINRPWSSNGVISYAGRLWWVDLSYGLLTCNVYHDEPDFEFVPLPEGCQLPSGSKELHKCRCVNMSNDKLIYVQIDASDGAEVTVSVWTLSSTAGLVWRLQHHVPFEDIWNDRMYQRSAMPRCAPLLALVHPKDSSVLYLFQNSPQKAWIFVVDLALRKMLEVKKHTVQNHHSSHFVTALEFATEGNSNRCVKKLSSKKLSLKIEKSNSKAVSPWKKSPPNDNMVPNFEREEVKDALKNTQSLLRLSYFALPALWTTYLFRSRRSSSSEPPANNAVLWMTVEMSLGLLFVMLLQQMMLIAHFIQTSAPRMTPRCRWLGPCGIWLVTSVWMGGYTGCIPHAIFKPWMWWVMASFALLNFVATILQVYWCRVREKHIIEA